MGLMDFLNKPGKEDTKEKIRDTEKKESVITINRENGKSITAFQIKKVVTFKHSDGTVTDLMEAKAITGLDGDTLIFSAASPVCFEVPQNNSDLSQYMIGQIFDTELPTDKSTYIGRAYSKEDIRFFAKPSPAVQQYVDALTKRIQKEIQRRTEETKKLEVPRNLEQEKSVEQAIQDYEDRTSEEREERIKHPFLRGGMLNMGEQYDGINLNNGEILRIRSVKKVAKDLSGTYIYTARLNSTPNETDVELLDREFGVPVIFTLPYRLNDIVNSDYSPEQKAKLEQSLLQQLSKGYTRNIDINGRHNQVKLHDIGGIDKNGRLILNNLNEISGPLLSKIRDEQQRYVRENLPQRPQEQNKLEER